MFFKYFHSAVCIVFAILVSVASGDVIDTIKGVVSDSASGNLLAAVTVASESVSALTDTAGAFTLAIPSTRVVLFQSPRRLPTLVWHPENGSFTWSNHSGAVSITVHSMQGNVVARGVMGKAAGIATFSIANLPQGIYAVTIAAQGQMSLYTINSLKVHQARSFSMISQSFPSGSSPKALATYKAHGLTFARVNFDSLRLSVPAGAQTGLAVKMKCKFKMPVLNNAVYRPLFDPSTVPDIQPLFDGVTLTGWSYDTKVWSVVNGYIKCVSDNTWCGTTENYSEFRLFISGIEVSQSGDHTGYGFLGEQRPPNGDWCNSWKFVYLVGPTTIWWDYVNNSHPESTVKADLTQAPYKLPSYGVWLQHEFLVSMSKKKIRVALNGVESLTLDYAKLNYHKDLTSSPIGIIGHYGNKDVHYKDIWIEVNPKEPDKLYSVTKKP